MAHQEAPADVGGEASAVARVASISNLRPNPRLNLTRFDFTDLQLGHDESGGGVEGGTKFLARRPDIQDLNWVGPRYPHRGLPRTECFQHLPPAERMLVTYV